MKRTFFLAAMIAPVFMFGQTIENLKDSKLEKVYRGFDNEFQVVGDADLTKYDYELKCVDCEIERINEPTQQNTFILRAGKSKNVQVILYSKDGTTTNYPFEVSNLPVPMVKIGNTLNGGLIDFDLLENINVELVYPQEITLRMDFQIKSMRVEVISDVENVAMVSEGSRFSDQTAKLLSGLAPGEKVKIEIDILDENQILRKKELTLIAL